MTQSLYIRERASQVRHKGKGINSINRDRWRACLTAWFVNQFVLVFGWFLSLFTSQRALAQDHMDFRYEYYKEGDGRIQVDTYALLFQLQSPKPLSAMTGELIYDGISGATPTGSPPLLIGSNTNSVPLAKTSDIRRAMNLSFDCQWGIQTFIPEVAYSKENDYQSIGLSLTDEIALNEKNTTLQVGVAHNFDEVQPSFFPEPQPKDTTEFIGGVTQLLGRKTVLTANFTYGTENGYLDDPYKGIRFDGWLPLTFIFPENRPSSRDRQSLYLKLAQYVDPANASVELSYRFYHDSWDVYSNTAAVTWYQKIGRYLIIEPSFRYYQQSAAYFYYVSVPGFAPDDGDPARPKYYSADYRLSHLETFTYGVQAVVRFGDRLYIDLGYQRYAMQGLDNETSPTAYPKANIYTAGARLWF